MFSSAALKLAGVKIVSCNLKDSHSSLESKEEEEEEEESGVVVVPEEPAGARGTHLLVLKMSGLEDSRRSRSRE